MSFVTKLIENKQTIALLLGSVTIGALLYKFSKQEMPQQKKLKQILKLKRQINCFHPSKADIQKLLAFCVRTSKQKIKQIYKQIQKKHSQLSKQNLRDIKIFKQYLNFINDSISRVQNVGVDEIFGISAQLGVSAMFLRRDQGLLQQSLRKTVEGDGLFKKDGSEIKIEQVRQIMKKQIEWSKRQKDYFVDMMLQCIKDWPEQKKSGALELYRYIRADIILKEYPNISTLTYLNSKQKYLNQLIGQYQQLQIAQVHSIIKLNAGIRQKKASQSGVKQQVLQQLLPHQINQLKQLSDLQMDSYTQMNKMIQKANH